MKSSYGPVRLGSKDPGTLNENLAGGVNSYSPREPFGCILQRQKFLSFWLWHYAEFLEFPQGTYPLGHAPGKLRGSVLLFLRAQDLQPDLFAAVLLLQFPLCVIGSKVLI